MVPHLQLFSLGAPLLLTEGGEQVRFRTRKHFALLIRLAVEAGRKLTRDYLMDLLWPDAPAHLARHSLAQALTVVKQKVGREHLQVQRATIALAPEAVDADVRRLDACAVQIRGPFLDGFEIPGALPFEQWKDEWRANLMPRIRDCLVKQMDAGRRIGDFATVERHAQVLLELDPLSEDAVRGVMEARAWVGDRTNALKVYGRFEARLAEELGAKPSADLARIAGLLREGRRPAPRPVEPGQVAERHERRFEAETLIGREQEFARLYDAWLEVRRRAPRIVVLVGDPGVGKTTLTNAFVSTCQMEGAVVARAQAYDAERELPFAVLAELIKQLTLQRAIGAADPEALSELSRVSPDIFNAFPGVPRPVEWSAEVIPLRLADSFLKAVEAATEDSSLVLVVDDIHAADNASAAILHVAARKLPRTRLLLILTARSNELRTAASPSTFVSDSSIQALQAFDLEPLPPAAAERLVAAVTAQAERRLADVPVGRILQASNGNPLALELLTKEWLAHGSSSLLSDLEALNTQPVANLGIPRAIGAVFERQIRRLDGPTRAALDLAAVLGRRLADLPLYAVVDLSPAAAGEALSRLKDDGFLREVHGELEFRNELIRAQAYYAVAGPARQHLHREVGEVLAGRHSDDGQSLDLETAWQLLRGGDRSGALTPALRGAEAALRVGAPAEAEEILSNLARHPPPGGRVQSIQFLLAQSLMDQSKAASAAPVLEQLLLDDSLSPREVAEVTRMHAAAMYLVDGDTGSRHCDAAARALVAARSSLDLALLGRALFEYARSGAETGDERRVQLARQEVETALREPAAQKVANLHYAQAYCHFVSHDAVLAAECLSKCVRLLSTSGEPVERSRALTGLSLCYLHICNLDKAVEAAETALELATKIGDDSRASINLANLCSFRQTQDRFPEAIELGRKSIALGRLASDQPSLLTSYLNLAEALMMTGQRDEALDLTETARARVREKPSWRAEVQFLCETASLALMMGNTALALEQIALLERLVWGKGQSTPEPHMVAKLKIFRTAYTSGFPLAREIALAERARFCHRNPYYYLDAMAACAWVEKRMTSRYEDDTQRELDLFVKLGVPGKLRQLEAQGFLP